VPRPRGGDWLEDETNSWRRAGIDMVVSLLGHDEEVQLGLEGEATAAAASGVLFTPFPVPDRGVPVSYEPAARLVGGIVDALDQGKTVAVHCRQSVGRSGLIAGAVLVAGGDVVQDALRTVGESRGIEVPETDEQRRWLRGFASRLSDERAARFAEGGWFRFPQTRRSFSTINQLMPTRVVRRGDGPASAMDEAGRADIDGVRFQPIGRTDSMTWAQSLVANYTDGILVLHRGCIVYERYVGALAASRPHLAFSVTKSFVGTVAAMLIAEQVLDVEATVASYLPELRTSGIGDATIRQLLDMTTSLDYTEDYTDPRSSAWDLARAGGFLPRPPGYRGPESFFDYLKTLRKSAPHGEAFSYKTVNTDALGAVLRRLTGMPLSDVLSERIFSRLGPDLDGYITVDSTGVEFAGGGLNLTLRDMARFGETMRLRGRFNAQQIVPASVLDDIQRGGDRARFAANNSYPTLPGWSYRNMWWISHNAHGAFMARGIHGQAIYVDPVAEMVIARFASHPLAANVNLDPTSLPAYDAVARHLMGGDEFGTSLSG
jgi:CubicO group peptidase (beta-lactamase class C family)/protein-tyrosine phosphatase